MKAKFEKHVWLVFMIISLIGILVAEKDSTNQVRWQILWALFFVMSRIATLESRIDKD